MRFLMLRLGWLFGSLLGYMLFEGKREIWGGVIIMCREVEVKDVNEIF